MSSIESSLWPLIVWMRACGFRIGTSKSSQSIWLVVLGAFLVLSTAGLHCTSFINGVIKLRANEVGPNGTNLTTANLLNIGIEHLNYTCILIGVHAGFYFISLSTSWKDLWESLLLIEEQLNFRPKFYRKCRKCVVIGFILFSSVNTVFPLHSVIANRVLLLVGLFNLLGHVDSICLLGYGIVETSDHFTLQHFSDNSPECFFALLCHGQSDDTRFSRTQREDRLPVSGRKAFPLLRHKGP